MSESSLPLDVLVAGVLLLSLTGGMAKFSAWAAPRRRPGRPLPLHPAAIPMASALAVYLFLRLLHVWGFL